MDIAHMLGIRSMAIVCSGRYQSTRIDEHERAESVLNARAWHQSSMLRVSASAGTKAFKCVYRAELIQSISGIFLSNVFNSFFFFFAFSYSSINVVLVLCIASSYSRIQLVMMVFCDVRVDVTGNSGDSMADNVAVRGRKGIPGIQF